MSASGASSPQDTYRARGTGAFGTGASVSGTSHDAASQPPKPLGTPATKPITRRNISRNNEYLGPDCFGTSKRLIIHFRQKRTKLRRGNRNEKPAKTTGRCWRGKVRRNDAAPEGCQLPSCRLPVIGCVYLCRTGAKGWWGGCMRAGGKNLVFRLPPFLDASLNVGRD